MKNSSTCLPNPSSKILGAIALLAAALTLSQTPAIARVNVLTQHNDLSRTGANTSETILTTANVASTAFQKLFANSVDGQIYAQPLYVSGLAISNGIHNVIFVCTESNSVYAFDADAAGVTYWHKSLGAPYSPSCGDLSPIVGISGTPVIDLSTGTLFVDTKLAAGPAQKLHALDITTGAEKFGGPVTITGSLFSADVEHQRPGLLLLNGVVYVGFGSHCDNGSYHGFLFGYSATNLARLYAFNVTPTGSMGAIWSGGMAPVADANGFIYVMTGNGTFDGVHNFSESMLKLSPSLTLEDFATPSDYSTLTGEDADFGSGGPVWLPPHYLVGVGKDGVLSLADTENMGQVGNFTQQFQAMNYGDTVGKSPVYWQGPSQQYLFVEHSGSATTSFAYNNGIINTTPLGVSSYQFGDRCGGISLSANGNTDGILWEIGDDSNMRAYDAVKFPKVLWSGSIGTYVKMTCPTIANGKVYVGTANNLGVWGLTNFLYSEITATNLTLSWGPKGTLLQSTNPAGPWVTNSKSSPGRINPTNTQQFFKVLLGN